MPGLDRQHVQADRDGQEERQRVVADREPEDDRRRDQPAVRARVDRRPRPAVAADAVVPADEQPEQDRDEREVEDVRVGVRADRPGDRRQRRARGRRRPRGRRERVSARTRSTVTAAATPRQTAESRFIRNAVVAERLEHDRGEPAQEDVGREARRVGRAQDGPDRLELPGVPERDAGQQREAREGERHDADREGRRQVRGARTATLCYAQIHLPRSCRSRSR